MLTNGGKNDIKNVIGSSIIQVAVGSGTTAPSATDTTLDTQEDIENIEALIDGATGIITVRTRFGVALAATLTEIGMFDVTPTLQDRNVFAPMVKPPGVEALFDIQIEVS